VAGAKQPHHSNSTQPPLASGTADGPFQDRSPRRRFCLSTRTLRAIKNVLWLTRLQSASTGCDSSEYRHHHSTSEVAHSMVPQCGTVAIPSTINDCVRQLSFQTVTVRSWLWMESTADWFYVDCYRYTSAFVISISIVFLYFQFFISFPLCTLCTNFILNK